MRFDYQYRTRDNVLKSGVVCALTRDEAFAVLKSKGIRPIRVQESKGFWNKFFGKWKRWTAIVLLLLLLLFVLLRDRTDSYGRSEDRTSALASQIISMTRRQPIGDAAVIERGIRTGWASVFEKEGDRFLASFAIPGVPAGKRNVLAQDLLSVLDDPCLESEGDGLEARQIKSMVAGMKDELREYLNAGGSVMSYGSRLVERQEYEIARYNRAKKQLDCAAEGGMSNEELECLWENLNEELRGIGVPLLQMPGTDEVAAQKK